MKIEIVRYVVASKLLEKEEAKSRAERLAKKQRLLEVLQSKQDAKLLDMAEEDLQKMISEL